VRGPWFRPRSRRAGGAGFAGLGPLFMSRFGLGRASSCLASPVRGACAGGGCRVFLGSGSRPAWGLGPGPLIRPCPRFAVGRVSAGRVVGGLVGGWGWGLAAFLVFGVVGGFCGVGVLVLGGGGCSGFSGGRWGGLALGLGGWGVWCFLEA